MKFFIHYTLDKEAYYITTSKSDLRPRHFLSVKKIPGPHTKFMEESGGFGPTYIEIIKPDGETYCRKVWGFWGWSMKTIPEIRINMKDNNLADMVADYAGVSHWIIDFRNISEKIKDKFNKKSEGKPK